jgi:hypothetical protein
MTAPEIRRVLPQVKAAHALAADTEAQTLVDGLADALTETEEGPPDG